MPRLLTRRWTLALLAGILVGVVAAVAIPNGAVAPAGPSLTKAPALAVGDREMRVAAADGSVHVVARTADPGGGPEWAIRVFTAVPSPAAADERSLAPDELRRVRATLPRQRCAQLGRIVDGGFGWIDGANVFRPAGFGSSQAPTLCGEAGDGGHDADHRPRAAGRAGARRRRVGDRRPGRCSGRRPHAVGRREDADDHRRGVRRVRRRRPRPRQVRVRSPLAGGGTELLPKTGPSPQYPATVKRPPAPALELGVAPIIQARAPDPSGGLPYGIAAVPNVDGGWCLGAAGRVVAGRVGHPDPALGTLGDPGYSARSCSGGSVTLTEATPIGLNSTGGDDGFDPGTGPAPSSAGQIARRTLPGRTAFYGRALPSVRTLTFSTPRDERTIAPSGPAHAFIVEYDGSFPTGSIVITARFADGTTKEIRRIGAMPGQ